MSEPRSLAFSILGREFRANGVSDQLVEWLREFWEYPDRGVPHRGYHIHIDTRAGAPSQDVAWSALDLPLPDRTMPFHASGQRWRAGNEASGVQLELRNGASHIELWGWQAAADPSLLHLALYVMITEGLRASGLLPIHAAVAATGASATAWLGGSGQGKSTTLLRAARAGWRPIAEDMSWLDPTTLIVHGWDRTVRVWPETLKRFFPHLNGPAASDGKRMISYDDIGGREPRSAALTRIALLAREPESASRWEPVTAINTTRALWEATGVPLSRNARDLAARAIGELVTGLPAARLVLGDGEPALTQSH